MAAKTGQSLFVIGVLANIHLSQAKEYCEGGYYCESGHCCGENKCCTYYYELWWFWVIWVVVALIGICCFYQQRRRKLRRQRCHRQRSQHQTQQLQGTRIRRPVGPSAQDVNQQQFHRPVYDVDKLFHLPTYDEAQQQVGAPPAYSQLYATTMPQTAIGQPPSEAPSRELPSVQVPNQQLALASAQQLNSAQNTQNTSSSVPDEDIAPARCSQVRDVSRQLLYHQPPSQLISGASIPTTDCQIRSRPDSCDIASSFSEPYGASLEVESAPAEIDDSLTATLLDNTEDHEFQGTLQLMSPLSK